MRGEKYIFLVKTNLPSQFIGLKQACLSDCEQMVYYNESEQAFKERFSSEAVLTHNNRWMHSSKLLLER